MSPTEPFEERWAEERARAAQVMAEHIESDEPLPPGVYVIVGPVHIPHGKRLRGMSAP